MRSGRFNLMAVGSYRLPRIGITFTLLLGRPLRSARCWRSCGARRPGGRAGAVGWPPHPHVDRRRRAGRGREHARRTRERRRRSRPPAPTGRRRRFPSRTSCGSSALAHRPVRALPLAAVLGVRRGRRGAAAAGRGPAVAPAAGAAGRQPNGPSARRRAGRAGRRRPSARRRSMTGPRDRPPHAGRGRPRLTPSAASAGAAGWRSRPRWRPRAASSSAATGSSNASAKAGWPRSSPPS